MNKKHESIQLFTNPHLEKLTHVHPLIPLLFWTPVVIFLMWRTFFLRGVIWSEGLVLMAGGLLVWTLVEYLLHRFLFHFEASHPWGKRIVYLFHGIHHDDPHDATRLVMPIVPALIYAGALYLLFCSLLGQARGEGLLAFFLIGYLCYDYIHFAIHHFVPRTRVGRYLRKSHLTHHVRPEIRFGVSSPLWDMLWGTLEAPRSRAETSPHASTH